MIPSIDFLPATYHVQRQREHKTLWRRMMVFFFLALAVLGTWQQHQIRLKLEARRNELQAIAEGLTQAIPVQATMDHRLKELETRAQLLMALEMRVPMTRVLSSITGSLPELVSLNECQADVASTENSGGRRIVMTPMQGPGKTEKALPFDADLHELRDAVGRTATTLTLSGIAPDDFAISQYLVALRETKLFDRVTFAFTGQHQVRDEPWRNFQLRLQVKNPETWLDRISKDPRVAKTIAAPQSEGAPR